MANKENYLARLQTVIMQLHHCGAIWRESIPVKEIFNGKTLWDGEVEVFDLFDHPKAKCCYGWSYGEPEQFITVLELPPVTDAQSAVRVGVAYQIKKPENERFDPFGNCVRVIGLDGRMCCPSYSGPSNHSFFTIQLFMRQPDFKLNHCRFGPALTC